MTVKLEIDLSGSSNKEKPSIGIDVRAYNIQRIPLLQNSPCAYHDCSKGVNDSKNGS